ncbi:MAG: sigma-54 dependent transcriptional regulator [Rikenellaceae bacterium]|nr:sigma-54 dependent transcriptional regulator [Rikenellaceae bacterium]MCL2692233.1 sigma-54 dependent transcriptional regulator [Rikenellaceae bacterium]
MDNLDKLKILILDSSKSIRNALKERLEFEEFVVDAYETLEEGYAAHAERIYDILLCDGAIGDEHASAGRREVFRSLSTIIMSGNPSVETVVHAIRDNEAFDFVSKPIDMNQLLAAIRGVVALARHNGERAEEPQTDGAAANKSDGIANRSGISVSSSRALDCPHHKESVIESIIGESVSINHVKSLIDKVGPSDARVLITGPNGTGKELVARWLHEKSGRHGAPFVEVNCAAIPSELIESELFGHEKGAFTSAVKQRKGKFEQADGGTLFLDEIGDMSLSAQAKVLRALQEHKVSRVGGDKDIHINVRIVSATNKNLREEIRIGNFREDLYHRLSVIIIHVPPLIDRLDDIPLLVNYFVRKICVEYGIPEKSVEQSAFAELQTMHWTGNIRELRNVVERLIILSGEQITLDDVKIYASGNL